MRRDYSQPTADFDEDMRLDVPLRLLPANIAQEVLSEAEDWGDTLTPDSDAEVNARVLFNGGWFRPGRTSGPADHCYPDEGEQPEIVKILLIDRHGVEIEAVEAMKDRRFIAKLQDTCWEIQEARAFDSRYD